ncbi:MAG: DUF2065 family protein [Acidobacteria bacterium]|nr:DUF2065 family protein [Acidobacteriota bacterium]
MDFDVRLLAVVLGLVLIIEGLPYLLVSRTYPFRTRATRRARSRSLADHGFALMAGGVMLLIIGRWVLQ